jgi:hypothetical protein
MIESADDFIRLRTSELKEDCDRAAHDEAPLDVWWELVHNHPDMRVWVVHNKTVPTEILEALSTNADAAVRSAVARKRKASPGILERLARDPDESVRHAVACNAKTPEDILRLLLDDSWDVVVEAAKSRLTGDK